VCLSNFGAEKATGKILVFLDSDTYLGPDTLCHCVREFDLRQDVGGVAFKVIDPKDGRIVFPFREELVGDPCFYHSFMGCAYAFRKEVFLSAGKYDEDLPIYGTEEDISVRVLDLGYQIKYVPQCVAYHEGGHPKYNRPALFMESIVANTSWHFIHYYPFQFMVLYAAKDVLKKSNKAFSNGTFRSFCRGLVRGLRYIPREWRKRKVSPYWNWVDLYMHVFGKQICHH